jgi:heme/copper-type cytochrome/quinol oxidase subunit 3
VAITALVTPLVAWAVSLAGSYLVQDFICSAARSADRPSPGATVDAILIALNAAMLALCVAAGALAAWSAVRARRRDRPPLVLFLAVAGMLGAVLFAYGVVLIGTNPLIYGGCQ